jgi:hypothetical protein
MPDGHSVLLCEQALRLIVNSAAIANTIFFIYEKFPCIVVVTSLNNSFQKFTHKGGNLRMMAFEGKVSAGDEMDFGIGQVTLATSGTQEGEGLGVGSLSSS